MPQQNENSSPRKFLGVNLNAIMPVVVTAIVTLGTTYITGFFGVWTSRENIKGQLLIEERRFSYERLKDALSTEGDEERARALLFLVESELVREPAVNVEWVKELANDQLAERETPEASRAFPIEFGELNAQERAIRTEARVNLAKKIINENSPKLNQNIIMSLQDPGATYREQLGVAVALGLTGEPLPLLDRTEAITALNTVKSSSRDSTLRASLDSAIAAVSKEPPEDD